MRESRREGRREEGGRVKEGQGGGEKESERERILSMYYGLSM